MKTPTILLIILIVGIKLSAQSPQLIVEYDFNENLTDKKENSTLQAFTDSNDGNNHNNATSGFDTDANGSYWYWTSNLSRGGGFWIDLDADVNLSTSYTIGVRFSYTLVSGSWRKIIDYSNLTQDYGFYFYNNGYLRFYSYSPQGINQASADVVVDVIATRAANNTFTAYFVVNGNLVQEFTVSDASNWAVPTLVSGKRRLNFFHDDNVTSTEATNGGKVYSVKIWDGPISSADIGNAMNVYWEGNVNTNWDNPANWSNNSVPTSSNDIEILNVPNKPVIESGISAAAKNIAIISNSSVTINEGGKLTVNENITNNGHLAISSGSSGNGSLITSTISGNGNYSVERYLTANQWHLVSSPISLGTAGVFEGIWLRPYEESTNAFGEYIQPPATPMPTGQGFSVWAPSTQTRTFNGTINAGNQGPFEASLTGESGLNTGWNLIGNPYTSAIDWDAASGWTKTNIATSVYIWNNSQYASYIGGIGTNGGSRYISMGQGFFVQATASGASVSMNKNVQVHNGVSFLKNESEPSDIIRVAVSANGYSDETVLAIRPESSNYFDPNTDAVKFYGSNLAPQIFTKKDDDSQLAISSLNSIYDIPTKVVYVNYAQEGIHNLMWTHTFLSGDQVALFDNLTQNFIPAGANYEFTASYSDPVDRFSFIDIALSISINESETSILFYDNILNILNPHDEEINYEIHNLNGQIIESGSKPILNLNHLSPAIYFIKLKISNKTFIEKIVVN